MTTEEFTYLLKNPGMIQEHQVKTLEQLCHTYPYLQSAKAIYLKALKDKGSYQYNEYLKKAAAHTVDRWVLFDFITSPVFIKDHSQHATSSNFEELEVMEAEVIEVSAPPGQKELTNTPLEVPVISNQESSQKEEKKEENKPEPGSTEGDFSQEPIPFKADEKHSFAEWLQLTNVRPLHSDLKSNTVKITQLPEIPEEVEKDKISEAQERKFALIDNFISKNPKIKPADKKSPSRNLAGQQSIPPEELMTETLARVYTAQHKYKKAIQAYKILILKNPEKSGFFADQIRAIQKIQDTKS
ncbi:hypothetical protein NBT05_02885 [Aquimarina sp. ERC-38]|uniref:hypothetical protein n=1 Tax=Aquimarina sp. ERC-38 TaxID=2949996 RepID=UPI0022474024|nr:hypothetical protein [Aquimarina sp. ERC-38]UZO81426.1 hypothetical protein NBT05_02885 [Aquimarina sp. ERC-38]